MVHRTLIFAVAAAALVSSGCQEVRLPGVYRIDIQQGNVITQEQLAALERGMEKRKVRFILGTPLVADTFNQDRWDYYYSIEKRGEDRMQRIISVFFEDERLARVSGDVLAALGPIKVESRKDEVVTVPEGYRDQGLLAALTPDFLGRKRRPEADESESSAGESAPTAAGDEDSANQPLQISEEDERYLREVLAGFGRGATVVDTTSEPQSQLAPTVQEERDAEAEQEGVFSRWARRLGLKDDGTATPPPPPPRASE